MTKNFTQDIDVFCQYWPAKTVLLSEEYMFSISSLPRKQTYLSNSGAFPCQITNYLVFYVFMLQSLMNFQEFVIPSIHEDDSNSYTETSSKMNIQSTCFESSAHHDDHYSDSDEEEEDSHHKKSTITRFIRKKYDPIVDGNRIIKYEDDPVEYKKARKKIQNRISANKVRGKKRSELEVLQLEISDLRGKNSELTLINSKLQGENSILKQRVNFLEKVVLKQEEDKISSFISTDHGNSSHSSSSYPSPLHSEFSSPFENDDDDSSWFRSRPSSPAFGRSGAYILVMTLILAVVILPSSGPDTSIVATKIADPSLSSEMVEVLSTLYQNTLTMERLKYWGKLIFVGLYLGALSLFAYKKRAMFIKRKKTM